MKKFVKNIFFFSFYPENQICRYFHHIRNQRLKIRGIVSFKLIGGKYFSEVHPFLVNMYIFIHCKKIEKYKNDLEQRNLIHISKFELILMRIFLFCVFISVTDLILYNRSMTASRHWSTMSLIGLLLTIVLIVETRTNSSYVVRKCTNCRKTSFYPLNDCLVSWSKARVETWKII